MKLLPIVICGGHFSPALAVIEQLREDNKYFIYYIGRKKALEGDESYALEYFAIRKLGIPFFSITAGRFQRSMTWYTLFSLIKVPIGILQSLYYLIKIKPKIVISFGGYVALSVCIAAWIYRIPIITHEQTTALGLSNRIIAKLAKYLCLSWKETKYIPKKIKTITVGFPIRKMIFSPDKSPISEFGNNNLPLVYITGGSLGARFINQIVAEIVPSLINRYRIIHQCGSAAGENDYRMLQKIKDSLPSKDKKNHQIYRHIDPSKIGEILKHAYLVISRAGANTVAEIAVVGIPAILIPLPWAANNEQEENAKILEKLGLAIIIRQNDLTVKNLIDKVKFIENRYSSFKNNWQKTKKIYSADGAVHMVKLVDDLLGKQTIS